MRRKRRIHQVEFVDGQRHGRATWWYANGQTAQEATYDRYLLDGVVHGFSADGKLIYANSYEQGRKLAEHIEKFADGSLKSKAVYLLPAESSAVPDNWDRCTLATFQQHGQRQRHGSWSSWHVNGQKQGEGSYKHDLRVGHFVWWHSNGQKALEGDFEDGEQVGKWIWWHESGQKSLDGEFSGGHPSGLWTWWNVDGKVTRESHMSQGADELVKEIPPVPDIQVSRMPKVLESQAIRRR